MTNHAETANTIYATASKIAKMPKFTMSIENDAQESIAMGQLAEMRDTVTAIAQNLPAYGSKEYHTAKKVIAWFNNTAYAINFCNAVNVKRVQYAAKI